MCVGIYERRGGEKFMGCIKPKGRGVGWYVFDEFDLSVFVGHVHHTAPLAAQAYAYKTRVAFNKKKEWVDGGRGGVSVHAYCCLIST